MKVVCLGSLNLDHVYTMDHFVQAGETTAALAMQVFCGGKGLNQSIALQRAGCPVYHAGMLGQDGGPLLALLQENVVDTRFVRTVDAPTGHAVIQVDQNGQNCIIIYGGANAHIDEAYIDEVYAHFEAGDIVLLQNEISSLPYAIRSAHQRGLRIALNPSPITDTLATCEELKYVTWFILNELEGKRIAGAEDGETICRLLHAQYPTAKVLLTLGEYGCMYYDGVNLVRHGIFSVPVVDTTAAGDTFTGYFLAGICEELPMPHILRMASKASAMAVSVKGAAASIPLRTAVEKALLE